MTATVYTFHAAYDHSIVAAFELDNEAFARHAMDQASLDNEKQDGKTRRYYVHNGRGVIAAFLTRNNVATQILRDDYMKFSAKAKELRAEAELPND